MTVLSKVIDSVDFSFYNNEEIHAVSVKKISNPNLFDTLGLPVPGGLYDQELGPHEQNIKSGCVKCGLPFALCPGHCGHIDLVLPVFNPLVYPNLVKLFRSICIFCCHFKMPGAEVAKFADKVDLIAQGRMVQASNVIIEKKPKKEKGSAEDERAVSALKDVVQDGVSVSVEERALIPVDDEYDQREEADSSVDSSSFTWTSSQVSAAKEVIDLFYKSCPKTKCGNCRANVPGIRTEGPGRLFRKILSKGSLSANILLGVMSESLVTSSSKGLESDRTGEDQTTDMDVDFEDTDGISGREVSCTPKQAQGTLLNAFSFTKEKFLSPLEVLKYLKDAWEKEERMCSVMSGFQNAVRPPVSGSEQRGIRPGYEMFFLRSVLVTPNRFRPANKLSDAVLEHPQIVFYTKVLEANRNLEEAVCEKKADDSSTPSDTSKTTSLWLALQNAVSGLLDSSAAIGSKVDQGTGIRQLLEKKEGLFRMNMMGKRVNYAGRSVISPDPNLSVNEIGIPLYFAQRLTYPERVTYHNVHKLREAVENGPNAYPGATHVEDDLGSVTNLHALDPHKRAAIAKTLLSSSNSSRSTTSGDPGIAGKTVRRHLRTGDILLVNRQPTLHKPGIMGHRARVLTGEKTLRMHYANCSSYNADFDGDEINVHFPQDELARAEGYQIVNADEQFVVPTSGNPIRGLIQDHVVSGVLLTKRDTFLTKEMYQQLVYAACVSPKDAVFKRKKRLGVIELDADICPVRPAILKPQRLWTGKQVMTTVFNYVTHGSPPFSMSAGGKVPREYWGRNNGEDTVIFKQNEMICGVIDKAQFGKYGLVHAFQELYGCAPAGRLLSVFSRLFTSYMQIHGFTCGVGDLLLRRDSEKVRRRKLRAADKVGDNVYSRFVGGEKGKDFGAAKKEVERIVRAKGESASNRLDRMMAGDLNGVTSDVNNSLFPGGLLKPFPGNCFSLMTSSGAKGGLVNFTQISSLLGQQELEGKRVPRMASGKTLPCFSPWDSGARSGGFIGDRFLTGLRPQEYYFHCMAGRDGLVDTAVKTSRSGYLQRCLMKNLEGLRVHYDYTVRDSDGSLVQFMYGEDGLDVLKTGYLSKLELLAENQTLVSRRLGRNEKRKHSHEHGPLESKIYNDSFHGKVSEAFQEKVKKFMGELSKSTLRRLKLKKSRHAEDFSLLMQLKFISSLVPPGEPVGVLAAQSVGEPSTQMTLNTFHSAGRGEMNVTLGVPRLREILMSASETISTPIMTCPLKPGRTREDAERLATQLRRLCLVDIVESVVVGEVPYFVQDGLPRRGYKIRLKVYSPKLFPSHSRMSLEECETIIKDRVLKMLEKELDKAAKRGKNPEAAIGFMPFSKLGEYVKESAVDVDDEGNPKEEKRKRDVDIGEPDEGVEEEEDADEGADAEKRRGQETDEREYNDEEDEEEKVLAKKLQDADDYTSGFDNEDEEDPVDDASSFGEGAPAESEPSTPRSASGTASKQSKAKEKIAEAGGTDIQVTANGTTFDIQVSLRASTPIILMHEVLEKIMKEVDIRSVTGIEKCSVIEWKKGPQGPDGQPRLALQTDGVNFEGFWTLQDDLDLSQLETNNIALMGKTYGVEAARSMVLSEIKAVFGVYGIEVNSHHLSLLADFMTSQGGYRPCNRIGIGTNPSPFLKMTFETASSFLMDATLKGQRDKLKSPSARIVLGRVVEVGTGSFELLQNIDVLIENKGTV